MKVTPTEGTPTVEMIKWVDGGVDLIVRTATRWEGEWLAGWINDGLTRVRNFPPDTRAVAHNPQGVHDGDELAATPTDY